MSESHTLGEAPQKSPVPGIAITAVVVGTLSGALYWWTHQPPAAAAADASGPPAQAAGAAPGSASAGAPEPTPELAAAPVAPPSGAAPAGAAPAGAAPVAAPSGVAPPSGAAPAGGAPPSPVAAPAGVAPASGAAARKGATSAPRPGAGVKAFSAVVNGSLEGSVVGAVGRETGGALTQVVTRSLVWWLRVPQDLVRGDTVAVVYEERDQAEPLVHAVRYSSRKLGRTFEAVRFKPQGAASSRFYQPDASELELRLVDGPLDAWEQITARLKDGRQHKGIDFKTPVGTPVKATFDGVVTRRTWSFRSNGNSLEVEETGGKRRTALFLHLSELPKSAQPGLRVKKGDVLATSGNSGRSFAPHLHYQLQQGATVIDPFESHATTRLSLPDAERPAFQRELARLRGLLPSDGVAGL